MSDDLNAPDTDVIASRRALIDVIVGLIGQREALTVLGGHAIIEATQDVPALPRRTPPAPPTWA
ncbi:MAG: hypothetical protein LBG60_11410 [Bifidobacteriaceae bacterium]|nr:hypothetical protein [Bifidobacteriaceae bacterium]